MEYIGLIIEILFLGLGIYLYLFSIGQLNSADPKAQERASEFRNRNGSWLRIASLGLIAIMLINVILHIQQLLS